MDLIRSWRDSVMANARLYFSLATGSSRPLPAAEAHRMALTHALEECQFEDDLQALRNLQAEWDRWGYGKFADWDSPGKPSPKAVIRRSDYAPSPMPRFSILQDSVTGYMQAADLTFTEATALAAEPTYAEVTRNPGVSKSRTATVPLAHCTVVAAPEDPSSVAKPGLLLSSPDSAPAAAVAPRGPTSEQVLAAQAVLDAAQAVARMSVSAAAAAPSPGPAPMEVVQPVGRDRTKYCYEHMQRLSTCKRSH
jgi:hypothetical protein